MRISGAFAILLLAASSAFPQGRGDVKKGEEIFKACAGCHSVDGSQRGRAPTLQNLFLREKLINGDPMSYPNLYALIRDGYNQMPGFGVTISRTDYDDLVAYMVQFTKRPDQKAAASPEEAGKAIFEAQCAGCHSASEDRKVGPGLKGLFQHPKLANGKPVSEAAVREMVQSGGKGMPGFGDTLDSDRLNALLAYLKSL